MNIHKGILLGVALAMIGSVLAFMAITQPSFAQSTASQLTFNPAQIAADTGETKDVVLELTGTEGISGFNIILEAENATFESVNDSVQVSGGSAQPSDFSNVLDFVDDSKTQAKVSFVTTSLNDDELPTKVALSVKAKRSGSAEGVIRVVNDSNAEITGKEGVTYSLNPTNEATLGSSGGGENSLGNLQFSPENIETNTTTTNKLNITITEDQGISGFNIIMNAQNATIESIEPGVTVSGGNAESGEFSKVLDTINQAKTEAKVAYVTITADLKDEDLPTSITFTINVKKSSNSDGVITFNTTDSEITGPEKTSYTPVASNQATLTSGGGGNVSPTGSNGGGGDCEPYWAIGDANCTGPKSDEKDFSLWTTGFDAMKLGGPASLPACNTAGNIKLDFNKDNKVDLVDFEIWRRGKYGSVSNPPITSWPAECM